MPGIGPFKWTPLDTSKPIELTVKNQAKLCAQGIRQWGAHFRQQHRISLSSVRTRISAPDPNQGTDVGFRARMCFWTLKAGTVEDCARELDQLSAVADREALTAIKDHAGARSALLRNEIRDAVEPLILADLECLRTKIQAFHDTLISDPNHGQSRKELLDLIYDACNHRAEVEKGCLRTPIRHIPTDSREYGIRRAGLRLRVEEAQAEAQVVGKFKYLQKKTVGEKNAENLPTDADIAAIREIVEKALNDSAFIEDACNDVIFGSQALVGIYERNGEDALWHALAKAFAEADFTPADAELVINRIGTVGKSIEAVAAKEKNSPAKDHVMQRARILILLHRAYYKSHRQPVPELKNDGKQLSTYCQLVWEYEDIAEKIAAAKKVPFVNPTSFVSAGIFNQLSSFGFLTGTSLRFLTVNLLNLSTSVTVDQARGLFVKQLRGMSKGDLRDLHAPLQYYRAMLDGVIVEAGRQDHEAAQSLKETLDVLVEEFSREWDRRNLPVHTIEKPVGKLRHIERLGALLGVSFIPRDQGTAEGKGKGKDKGKEHEGA